MSDSPKYKLNTTDLKKIGVNGILVGVGATLAYFAGHLGELDLGIWAPLVVPAVTGLIDAAVKWVTAKKDEVNDK